MKENTCLACQECTNDYSDGNGNYCYDGRESPCMNAHYENDIEEIDLYDTKIDDDAMKSLKKADDCLLMIGVTCTESEEKENYYRINSKMIARNLALESMLASAKKELAEANETIAKLRVTLSRYECRVKGE